MKEWDWSHVNTPGQALRGAMPRAKRVKREPIQCVRCGNDIPMRRECGQLIWRTRYEEMKYCSKGCRWPDAAPDIQGSHEPALAVPTAPLLALIRARLDEYGELEWWKRCEMNRRSYHRLQNKKWVTIYAADRWCAALGKHFTEVYGREDLEGVA